MDTTKGATMNLTARSTRLLLGILFGIAAVLPATAAAATGHDPVGCDEWVLDEAGKPVCVPPKDECPPFVATCDEIAPCDEPGQCPPPPTECDPAVEECPDDTPPETDQEPDPRPARPVVVQPSFTG
jgi:hypothetical protein